MFRISTIADDYVTKGLHIHVEGVELKVRPDHQGGIVFKKVFASTPDTEAGAAAQSAEKDLANHEQVECLYQAACRALEFVRGYEGALEQLAKGRAAEFSFLIRSLKKMSKT